ncbi:alpha-hydroxy-acid oxidizing protein [Saccharomonospora xinjiangensis]|uniref:Alpha-hydroxyacid dehydrogenase, FMN-dependent L-lactate dehydrogenase n=1 Tax=Saccharomonospora xinjiangensis XJ-54 TaxID=882086 RepID=I0UYD9_9PSEU|nr:alpha-hydroxy-acid oxidizing protein [Saccharomonospora xinjiangensis]EID52892.1 alpha-hydroxyacid dehydrogenase, FMN-dependent L-lactate dehydrogenase [Saccharomonospora xinjiangensis XJ-54]
MGERFGNYQSEIYLSGYGGTPPAFTTDLTRLESSAERVLESGPFSYVAGGAGAGATMRANREAFERWGLVPRILTGATERDLTTSVLGETLPAPVVLAPVGAQSIVHPGAEPATARAAAGLGLPMVLSTASSTSIEEVAAASGAGPRWFQLYWPNDPDVCGSILVRARAAGYTVLVVTLDTWSLGWRPCDLDNGYLPFLRGEGTAVPFTDPVFRSRLDATPEEDPATAVLRWISMITGTDRDWDAVPFLREHWEGPIVLKGVQHVDDALRAADAGVDGIVVSNHGGRQVDGAVAALEVLPTIASAVGDRLDVLFDSGIRTGADVVKALALGAKAVLVGRPYVYGLAHGGEDGVRHVLRCLLADLDLTLALCGHRSAADAGRNSLVRR